MLISPNIRIYATTASTATQPSWACFWNKKRKTFLADVYSINWMMNSDRANFTKETLHQQFIIDRNETKTSTVCQYGDVKMSNMTLNKFQGGKLIKKSLTTKQPKITHTVRSSRVEILTQMKILIDEFQSDYQNLNYFKITQMMDKFIKEYNKFINGYYVYLYMLKKQSSNNGDTINSYCIKNNIERIKRWKGEITYYDIEALSAVPRLCRI